MDLTTIASNSVSIYTTPATHQCEDELDCDDKDHYIAYHLRPETYIVPFIFCIIFIVGVVGNGTLIIIFLRHRAMRNIPNT